MRVSTFCLQLLVLVLIIILSISVSAQIEIVVVEGGWGSTPGQFGYSGEGHPDYDLFPNNFQVDQSSNIIVSDFLNSRIQIFNAAGSLVSVISHSNIDTMSGLSLLWPNMFTILSDNMIVIKTDDAVHLYNYQGQVLKQLKNIDGIILPARDDTSFFIKGKKWSHYSADLELIKIYEKKPMELGKMRRIGKKDGRDIIRFQFEDRCYLVASKTNIVDYCRDHLSKFFVFSLEKNETDITKFIFTDGTTIESVEPHHEIWKVHSDGVSITSFSLPASSYEDVAVPSFEVSVSPRIIVQYGKPVVGFDGKIYFWARTSDRYKIIRWDSPGVAPQPTDPIVKVQNDPPVIEPLGAQSIKAGETLTFKIIANDPDVERGDDFLIYSATNLPPGATFNPGFRRFTWKPEPEHVGTYTGVQFEVRDTACHVAKLEITIVVEP